MIDDGRKLFIWSLLYLNLYFWLAFSRDIIYTDLGFSLPQTSEIHDASTQSPPGPGNINKVRYYLAQQRNEINMEMGKIFKGKYYFAGLYSNIKT